MNTLNTRSTAELRRLRDRATNETIRELLNAELATRFEQHPATKSTRKCGAGKLSTAFYCAAAVALLWAVAHRALTLAAQIHD